MKIHKCQECGARWVSAKGCPEAYFCYHCGEELNQPPGEIADEQPFEFFSIGDKLTEDTRLKNELTKTDWDEQLKQLKKEK